MLKALNRTLLLMGSVLHPDCSLEARLAALVTTRVVLQADLSAAGTAAGQSLIVTAATQMARSGHEVWLNIPPVDLVRPQPPLNGTNLVQALTGLGDDLLPGWCFHVGVPDGPVDLLVVVGNVAPATAAAQILYLDAGDGWAAFVAAPTPWSDPRQPYGALAAGAMAAAEAFKAVMRRLHSQAIAPEAFEMEFAPSPPCKVVLAPEGPLFAGLLPPTDMVSGGAIGNALVYALTRVPDIQGAMGILDDDRNDLTNLNRNAMLRHSELEADKVESLASHSGPVRFIPRAVRFTPGQALAPNVLIGVDHIPSRWAAQATNPRWIGVGATTGFCVQVSEHSPGQACAGCLHSEAGEPVGAIPTVAFVSFWAGLLLAVRWLRHLGEQTDPDQQTFFAPLRPEGWSYAGFGVTAHPHCPVGCAAAQAAIKPRYPTEAAE